MDPNITLNSILNNYNNITNEEFIMKNSTMYDDNINDLISFHCIPFNNKFL